jgi:hypothetical protein
VASKLVDLKLGADEVRVHMVPGGAAIQLKAVTEDDSNGC